MVVEYNCLLPRSLAVGLHACRKILLSIEHNACSCLPSSTLAVGLYILPPFCLTVGMFPTAKVPDGRLLHLTAMDPGGSKRTRSRKIFKLEQDLE
ncbi:unnamed protein product [Triticum turgidum subsp. durum]|uniref:Uncharacterized protein n=1 Tax=Triticum turgidum subsp. durum TaxID=4567 RepID=A0A9R1B2P6_TRITD|nr:unnamed protein product [Triticum turgidum subsp. durum]